MINGRVHYGVHPMLEAEADALIFGSLAGVTSQTEKKDVLTRWKEQDRKSREVLASGGVIEPALRRGIYGRAYNPQQPHLNSADGASRPPRIVDNSGINGGNWGEASPAGWNSR